MSVAYVDTDLLEKIGNEADRVLSALEESAGTLRRICGQMMAEDLRLSFYPQWEQIVDGCSEALRKAEALAETAERLKTLLETVPEEYLEAERRRRGRIAKLSVRMGELAAGIAGIGRGGYPVGLESEASLSAELEARMSPGMPAAEVIGLSAATEALKERYSYERVIPWTESLPYSRKKEEEEEE